MIRQVWCLAQSGASQGASQAFVWAAVMLVVIVLAVFIGVAFRKAIMSEGAEGDASDPLSLHTIRSMHARGELSDEEFAKARDAALQMAPGSNPLRDEIARRAREQSEPAAPQDDFNAKHPTEPPSSHDPAPPSGE